MNVHQLINHNQVNRTGGANSGPFLTQEEKKIIFKVENYHLNHLNHQPQSFNNNNSNQFNRLNSFENSNGLIKQSFNELNNSAKNEDDLKYIKQPELSNEKMVNKSSTIKPNDVDDDDDVVVVDDNVNNKAYLCIDVSNVVCSYSTRCHLNLRRIAMQGMHVEYKKECGVS